MAVRTIGWRNGSVVMIDQRLLPTREGYRVYRDHREVAKAIKDMGIRGAPAASGRKGARIGWFGGRPRWVWRPPWASPWECAPHAARTCRRASNGCARR